MKKGFTLIEIMVAVAIIGLLAAFSVSMMLRNRMTANETLAISACKTLVSACQSYYASTLPHVYPPNLAALGAGGVGPSYIDNQLASGTKSGYTYTYALVNPVSFTVNANPTFPGRTGNRHFYTDETGRITAREGGPAGPGDTEV